MKKRIEKKILKILDKIERNEKARTIFCNSVVIFMFIVSPVWAGLLVEWLANMVL